MLATRLRLGNPRPEECGPFKKMKFHTAVGGGNHGYHIAVCVLRILSTLPGALSKSPSNSDMRILLWEAFAGRELTGARAMTVEDVFSKVPVGAFLRFSGQSKNGEGKLVAKLPNCLDLEVWSLKGASLVLVVHADEGVNFEIVQSVQRPMTASSTIKEANLT